MKLSSLDKSYFLSLIVFLSLIIIAFITNVKDYVNDGVILIFLLTLLYLGRSSLKLNVWSYLLIAFGFLLHNFGVFGFYNVSPVFIQWDHVTHFFGELGMGVFVFNYLNKSNF